MSGRRGVRMSPKTDGLGPQLGLYYPYIHFADDEWVKLSALFWDRMARIVPEYYQTQDSDVVTALKDAFVVNLSPDDETVDAVASHFLKLLDSHGNVLRKLYGVKSAADAVVTIDGLPTGSTVLSGKMTEELVRGLKSAGLTVARPDPSGFERLYFHRRLSNVYMAALADEVSRQTGFAPVSNETDEHVAVNGLTVERIASVLLGTRSLARKLNPALEVESTVAMITLRMAMPRGLATVKPDRLLKFRQDHRDELSAYQAYLRKLTTKGALKQLSGIQDRNALRAHIQAEYERTVEPAIKELRSALLKVPVEVSEAAISIRMPHSDGLAVTAALANVDPHAAALVGTAQCGFALFRVVGSKRAAAKRKVLNEPAAFLMYAQEELGARNLLRRVGTRMRRITLGV